jgi:hypothetical protein
MMSAENRRVWRLFEKTLSFAEFAVKGFRGEGHDAQ